MSNVHDAILSRVTLNGLGYLIDTKSDRELLFTFDKIRDYKGQAAEDLGFRSGANVKYRLDDRGTVEDVVLNVPVKKKFFLAW